MNTAVLWNLASRLLLILAVSASLLASIHASAEVHYRWIDDRGNPVHSDMPPPQGVNYEVIDVETNFKRQVSADEGVVPPEVKPTVGNEFEPVKIVKVPPKKNPEYCERAQHNLYMLDRVARIRLRNEQGEYRYIDEEEKEFERQKARDMISLHCE